MNKLGFVTFCTVMAVAGASMSSAVSAQGAATGNPSDSPLYFSNVDKNGDGVISRSEVPKDLPGLRAHFDQYDSNRDHRLSEAEYVNYLSTLGSKACRDDIHTQAKCQISPYAGDARRDYAGESPAVRPPTPKASGGQ
jgi:hypothetical protein